jgi:hypothetical protein
MKSIYSTKFVQNFDVFFPGLKLISDDTSAPVLHHAMEKLGENNKFVKLLVVINASVQLPNHLSRPMAH